MKKLFTHLVLTTLFVFLFTLNVFGAVENYNEDCATIVNETVLKGTPILDGLRDEIYTDSMTVKLHGPASSYAVVNGATDTTATGTVYSLYDDEFVYIFFEVKDSTLLANDPAYVQDHPHPHLNDAVEVRIGDDLEDHFAPYDGSNDAHHLLYADAHGTRFTNYEESMGDDVEKLKSATIIDKANGKYYIEMAIPTQKAFKKGEMLQFNFQIDDLQDLETEKMAAIGLAKKPIGLVDFYCGGASSSNYNEDCATIENNTVLKGTPVIDGKLDSVFKNSLKVKLHGPASSYAVVNGATDTTATGTVYSLYDDEFVYVFFEVKDSTLLANDPAYVQDHPHPHLNDAVEVRIGDDLEDHFAPYDGSNDAHHLLYADAHGTRFTNYEESMGDDVEKLKSATIIDKANGKYYIEMAIPTQKAFKKGEMIQFNFQIDDLQDLETEKMAAIGLAKKPVGLVDFYCGAEATDVALSADNVIAKQGSKIEIPVYISGNEGVTGLSIDVNFDSNLEFVSVTQTGEGLADLEMTVSGTTNANSVKIIWDGVESSDSNGQIATLTFKVKNDVANGEYYVNVNVLESTDQDLKDVSVKNAKAKVTVRNFTPGDVNDDGEINLKDVIILRRYIVGGYSITYNADALDVNHDEEVSLKDVILVRRYIVGGYEVEL